MENGKMVGDVDFPVLFEVDPASGEATGTVMPFCSVGCRNACGGTSYNGLKSSSEGTANTKDFGYDPHCEQCGEDIKEVVQKQQGRKLEHNIVVEPMSTTENGEYTITITCDTAATTAELREKLQACYDDGAAGAFSIGTNGSVRTIVFTRDFSDDFELLEARLNKGEAIHTAARAQLADELESSQRGPDCLTAIIMALRDEKNGVVVGVAENRKLVETDAAPLWLDNAVQFPRLLAEIMATQELDLNALAESMDLSVDEVNELFDRADSAWEEHKAQLRSFDSSSPGM